MQENKSESNEELEKKLYTQQELDDYKAKLQAEFLKKQEEMKEQLLKDSKKQNMSELELAKTELEEYKEKYRQKEDECLMAKETEETKAILKDSNLGAEILDLVYCPKDPEKTKEKIQTLIDYIEKIKKELLADSMDAPLPKTSNAKEFADPFIEGFDSNRL